MKFRMQQLATLALIGLLLIVLLCSCGSSDGTDNTIEFTDEQMNTIFSQCVEDEELYASDYLDSKWFVSGEIFDIEEDDDTIYVYAYLSEGEYAYHNGRAYQLAGSTVPVKLTLEPETLKVLNMEYPEDGEDYDSSLKELFTKKAYKACTDFDPVDLNHHVEEQAKAEWDAEVDDNYQLQIDEDGNYEVYVIDHDGSDGHEFEHHVEESGKLEHH